MTASKVGVGNMQGEPGAFCSASSEKVLKTKKKNATRILKSPVMSVCPRDAEPTESAPND